MVSIVALFLGLISAHASSNNFSAGLQLGWPSGASSRYWIGPNTSLAGTAGFSLEGDHRFVAAVDHLWTKAGAITLGEETFDLSYGVGLGMRTDSGTNRRELVLGPRAPFVLSYEVTKPSAELYLSVAFNGGVVPTVDLYFDVALGFRLYLF